MTISESVDISIDIQSSISESVDISIDSQPTDGGNTRDGRSMLLLR